MAPRWGCTATCAAPRRTCWVRGQAAQLPPRSSSSRSAFTLRAVQPLQSSFQKTETLAAAAPPGMHRGGPSIREQQEAAAIHAAALKEAREALANTSSVDACHTEAHAEYGGEFVVKWGENHYKVCDCVCAVCVCVMCVVWVPFRGACRVWRRVCGEVGRESLPGVCACVVIACRFCSSTGSTELTAAACRSSLQGKQAHATHAGTHPSNTHRRTLRQTAAPPAPTTQTATCGCGAPTRLAAATGGSTESAG